MNYRKFTVVILSIVALALFAACAAGPETSQETAPAAEEVAAEEVATEEVSEEVAEEAETEAGAEAEAEVVSDETVVYIVDTAASTIEWYGSKPIGASESGTVAISEGQLSFNGTELLEGSFVIDMESIETTTQSGNMKSMLEDHLKSDDFFGIASHPTASLVIKSVEPTDVENQYTVVADLTIKEITEEITFVTDVTADADMLAATADLVIDRSLYDIRYNSGSFFSDLGDDLISDEMELTINLVAKS